jgi:hypothetical protein
MLSAIFKPVIPGIEKPQTYALVRTATGMGLNISYINLIPYSMKQSPSSANKFF